MERFEFAVKLTSANESGFVVTCRDLPALVTQGESREHALAEAADAMDEVFAAYMLKKLPLPAPSKVLPDETLVSPPAETLARAVRCTVNSGHACFRPPVAVC